MFSNCQVSPPEPSNATGRVASLHLHPAQAHSPLTAVTSVEVVEQQGIAGEPRYFGRTSANGQPAKRQISLMEREQIAGHSTALGLAGIPPGAVRANIETSDIALVALVGRQIEIGNAVLFIALPRDPCEKMDAICRGLRERMLNNRQGVLAQVLRSGTIRVGDEIRVLPPAEEIAWPASPASLNVPP